MTECKTPPDGWECSREAGHDGPCASRPKKPLKPARSQAELQAVKQRNIQIILVATNVIVTSLVALKTFGLL